MWQDFFCGKANGFSQAALVGDLQSVLRFLERGIDVNVTDSGGLTAVQQAVKNGHLNVVRLLLDRDASIDIATTVGWIALHCAASEGHAGVAGLLLDRGADINIMDKYGRTALNRAAHIGHLEVVRLLLDRGANVNTAAMRGWPALHWAACNGHLEVAGLLLDRGADINIMDKDGSTALHLAASRGHLQVVTLLLEKHASCTVADKFGKTPKDLAALPEVHVLLDRHIVQNAIITATNAALETAANEAAVVAAASLVAADQATTAAAQAAANAAAQAAVQAAAQAVAEAAAQAAADANQAAAAAAAVAAAANLAAENALIITRVLDSFSGGPPVPVPFSLIKQWTENFKSEIEKGAFGSVYSGIVLLPEEQEGKQRQGRRVAVKKIDVEGILSSSAADTEAGSRELLRSLRDEVKLLSSLHHPNIARLVGHCLPPTEDSIVSEQRMKELCLVYELAPKGGLDSCLTDDAKSSDLLWQYRLKIAAGAAKGLCYMHDITPGSPTYHRDMKSSNIALMGSYDPKILNCSLSAYASAPFSRDISILSHTAAPFGAAGYTCPHHMKNAGTVYDAKCDVYSFGIVLLELLTGKLQGHVGKDGEKVMLESLLSRGLLVADHRIHWPEGLVAGISALAAGCTAPHDERIDSMSTVMDISDSMNVKYLELGLIDDDVLRVNRGLIARLESLQLQQDIRIMDLETTHKCEICFEENIPAGKGVTCSNRAHPHFFCGAERNGCFGDMVSSQSSDYSSFVRNSLGIVCGVCTALVPRVVTAFDASVVARHSSDEVLATFIRANTNAGRCEGQRALEAQRLQHQDEIQRMKEAAMAHAARLAASAERHRLRIMDTIVTLHCPHCSLAILDFDGCFAVEHRADNTDHGHGCGLYFCGWCLDKFGNNADCHLHVKICPNNLHPGTYYGTFPADFNRVHGTRRRNLVLQYLRDNIPDDKEREETTKAIKGDLADVGIDI